MLVFLANADARAGTSAFYKETNLIGGYSDLQKWVGKKGEMLKNSIGFEYLKKFSNDYGDFLTGDLQMRFSYDSLEGIRDSGAIEIHNAWLEYKLGLGSKLRLGHFDPAFGLEPLLDTHATLLKTLADKNIGFTRDWGVSYSGLLGNYDYLLAAQMGSGMSIRSREGSHLLTGRIGNSLNQDFQYGLSLLYGEVLETMEMQTYPLPELTSDHPVTKRRVGLDAQYFIGPYQFKGEVAYGKNDQKEVAGILTEVDYTVPFLQALQIEGQSEFWSKDITDQGAQDITLSLGASYKINSSLTARLGYFHDVEKTEGDRDRQIILQLYYYGF
jgi:hypothetical protein